MTAKDVSVGLTYLVKVGDDEVPVTLTKECEWGGWYGREVESGHPLRIATAGRLRKQVDGESARREARMEDNAIHTTTQEATMAATTTAAKNTDAKAARAARRAKPATAAAKPAAAPAAKKTPARRTRTAKQPDTISVTQDQLADMIAKAVAEIQSESAPEAAPAAKPAAAKKLSSPAKSARTVKLKAFAEKRNSWQFKVIGTSKTPLVTACYVSNEALEVLEGTGEPLDLTLIPFDGKQPLNSIRFTDDSDSLRGGLYLMRNALVDSGITESTPVSVKLAVVNEDTISLTVSLA